MRFRRPPPMREVIKGWFTMRERPIEQSSLPKTTLNFPMPAGTVPPPPANFHPIFSAWHRASLVAVAPGCSSACAPRRQYLERVLQPHVAAHVERSVFGSAKAAGLIAEDEAEARATIMGWSDPRTARNYLRSRRRKQLAAITLHCQANAKGLRRHHAA